MALATALALLGLLAGANLDIDVLPDINRPTITVMTETPGLASEEVESLVTRPIELALTGLPQTLRVRSSSAVGLSIVNMELDWDANVVAARQQAGQREAEQGGRHDQARHSRAGAQVAIELRQQWLWQVEGEKGPRSQAEVGERPGVLRGDVS